MIPVYTRPSKSQRKRDATEAQDIGLRLTELPAATLRGLDLPDELVEALLLTRTVKGRGSLKRHLQFIGTLMRRIDTAPLLAALDALEQAHNAQAAQQQRLAHWRDALVNGDDALLEVLPGQLPRLDVDALRTLVARARQERAGGHAPAAYRALFRLLADAMETG